MREHVYRAVGEKLKSLRNAYGLTLQEVCAHLSKEGIEISEATLNRVENARTMLRLDAARKVFHLLGTPLGYVDEIIAEAESRQLIDTTAYSFDELRREGMSICLYGDYQSALAYFRGAYDRAKEALGCGGINKAGADRRAVTTLNRLARVMIDIADCHQRLRQFRLGLDCLGTALELPHIRADYRMGTLLAHASAYARLESFRRAHVYAEHASKGLGRASALVQAYGHGIIGALFLQQDRFSQAVPFYEQAVRIYEESGTEFSAIHSSVPLAFAYYKTGHPVRARCMLEGAYRWLVKNDRYLEPAALAVRYLGRMEFELGHYDEARERFKIAVGIARRVRLDNELFLSNYLLWRVEIAAGRKKAANQRAATLRQLLPRTDPSLPEFKEFLAMRSQAEKPSAAWH